MDIKDILKKGAILTVSGVATYYAIKYIDTRFPNVIQKIKDKIQQTKSAEVKDISISSDKRTIYEGDNVFIKYIIEASDYPINVVILSTGRPIKSLKAGKTGMVKLTFYKAGRYNIQMCSNKVCSNTISIVVKPKSEKPVVKPSPSPSPTTSETKSPSPTNQPSPSQTSTPSPQPVPTKSPFPSGIIT